MDIKRAGLFSGLAYIVRNGMYLSGILLLSSIFISSSYGSEVNNKKICNDWNNLSLKIRDQSLNKDILKKELCKIDVKLLKIHSKKSNERFYFPVKGYGLEMTGRGGYKPKFYNFLDGNKHKGHPAVDMFIYDKNQDCIDDKTGKPVEIVAFASGWVVAKNDKWTFDTMELRGGNFIAQYVPAIRSIVFYVHLNNVYVNVGDYIEAGTALATLGRTGKNAVAKRSTTHLHFIVLEIGPEGLPVPKNPFLYLKKSRKVPL